MKRFAALVLAPVAAGLLILPATADADVLALYQFDGGTDVSTDGNVGTLAGNFFTSGDATISSSTHTAFIFRRDTADNQSDGLDADDYWGFTVAPTDPGEVLNLETLTFDTQTAGQTGAGFFHLQSDVGGFGSTNPVIDTIDTTTDTTAPDGHAEIDLSAAQFQGLSSIEFRIFFHDDADDTNVLRNDNVTLNGAVVPEPASLALLATGGLLVLGGRRRARA